jgi:hypothetical protein
MSEAQATNSANGSTALSRSPVVVRKLSAITRQQAPGLRQGQQTSGDHLAFQHRL